MVLLARIYHFPRYSAWEISGRCNFSSKDFGVHAACAPAKKACIDGLLQLEILLVELMVVILEPKLEVLLECKEVFTMLEI